MLGRQQNLIMVKCTRGQNYVEIVIQTIKLHVFFKKWGEIYQPFCNIGSTRAPGHLIGTKKNNILDILRTSSLLGWHKTSIPVELIHIALCLHGVTTVQCLLNDDSVVLEAVSLAVSCLLTMHIHTHVIRNFFSNPKNCRANRKSVKIC